MKLDLIKKYVLGLLNKEENEAVQEKILGSENNLKSYTILKTEQIVKAIKNPLKMNVSIEYLKLRKQIKRQQQQYVLKIASMFVLFFALGAGFYQISKPKQLIATYKKGNTPIILKDGTKVTLNEGSTLKYSDFSNSNKREVCLEGEAFFDVTKNKTKPFIIQMDNDMSVTVLGTSFRLTSYKNSKNIVATLFEGGIKLSKKDKTLTDLVPNQQVTYNKHLEEFSIKSFSSPQSIKPWKDNWLIFEETPLKELVNTLERHFNINVNVEVENISEYEFTGKFKRDTSIDNILEIVKLSLNVNYKQNQDTITIYK